MLQTPTVNTPGRQSGTHCITTRLLHKQRCTARCYITMYTYIPRGPAQRGRYNDSQRTGRSWDGIPVGERFSAPVQTGPGVHSTSSTMGTGPFQGVKWPQRGVDHTPPSSAEVKEIAELYRQCLLSFGAEYFEFQCAVQKHKD